MSLDPSTWGISPAPAEHGEGTLASLGLPASSSSLLVPPPMAGSAAMGAEQAAYVFGEQLAAAIQGGLGGLGGAAGIMGMGGGGPAPFQCDKTMCNRCQNWILGVQGLRVQEMYSLTNNVAAPNAAQAAIKAKFKAWRTRVDGYA